MKLAILGGAGMRTVNFVNGLLERTGPPNIEEIALYDIDAQKQEVIRTLACYVAQKKGSAITITAAQDVRSALEGAQVVVAALRVGGDHSRAVDEAIALKHGVIGQETTGVGGFFMAARTIGPLRYYMQQIERYAPHATVFNFTNPSGLLAQALYDCGYRQVLGICDAPSSVCSRMADALHTERDKLDVRFAGLNHLSWITSVRLQDRELLPELLMNSDFLQTVPEFSVFDADAFAMSGFLPNEYLYYYYHREQALAHMRTARLPRGRMIEQINREMLEKLYSMQIEADPEAALQVFLYYLWKRELSYMTAETGRLPSVPQAGKLTIPSGMGYAAVMLDCLAAMESETPAHVVLNVPNQGTLPFLKDTDIAELSCSVSRSGIYPLEARPMGQHCTALITTVKEYERAAVQALLSGSKQLAIKALCLHPLVMSFSLAKGLIDDYISSYPDSVTLR